LAFSLVHSFPLFIQARNIDDPILIYPIVVDLGVYPASFFGLLLTIGLVVTRARRKRLNLPAPDYQAWHVTVGFAILSNLYMVVMPWYPPSTGATGGDVSFWYATYCAVAIGM
jgi:hypothetical protein